MTKLLDEIHPGEILLEDFMKPMGISARRLAADIDVPPSRISEIVHGQRPITADTALRLGLFFRWSRASGLIYKLNTISEWSSALCRKKLLRVFACFKL